MLQTTVKVFYDSQEDPVYEKVYDHQLCSKEKDGVERWLLKKFDTTLSETEIIFEDNEARCDETKEMFT